MTGLTLTLLLTQNDAKINAKKLTPSDGQVLTCKQTFCLIKKIRENEFFWGKQFGFGLEGL